jgi:hypothetical protein
MGCGYRVIAATPGVTAEERAEITRSSPSHGNLCSSDPAAEGLTIYVLSTGRRCIAWSRHAGPEPTGRGGLRIHTHAVLLSREAYGQLDFLPTAVLAALAALAPEPLIPAGPCLEPLRLYPALTTLGPWTQCPFGAFRLLAACVLAGRRAVVIAEQTPLAHVLAMLAVLPAWAREPLSVSTGLRYSPSRPLRIVCTSVPPSPAEQNGLDAIVLDTSRASLAADGSPPWLQLMASWWAEGRHEEILALTSALVEFSNEEATNRILMLVNDLDAIDRASGDQLTAMSQRYAVWQPHTPLEAALLEQLREALVDREVVCGQKDS